MCMEDVRIGRATWTRQTVVVIGTGITPIVGADPNRVGLLISGTGASNARVSTNPNMTIQQGFRTEVNTMGPAIDLWIARHGRCVTEAWWGIATANGSVAVIETFLLPQTSKDLENYERNSNLVPGAAGNN